MSHIIFTGGVIAQFARQDTHIKGTLKVINMICGRDWMSTVCMFFLLFFYFGVEIGELNSKRRKRWISFQVARSEERVNAVSH